MTTATNVPCVRPNRAHDHYADECVTWGWVTVRGEQRPAYRTPRDGMTYSPSPTAAWTRPTPADVAETWETRYRACDGWQPS